MPALSASLPVNAYTHRQCVALVRLIYPGGCGFDYKRASVETLHAFLQNVRATYPQQFDAALQAFLAAHAAPAVAPAPQAAPAAPAPIMAPPAPLQTVGAPSAPVAAVLASAAAVAAAPAPVAPPAAPAPLPAAVSAAVAPAPVAPAGALYTLIPASDAFPGVKWPDGFNASACMLRHYHSPDAPAADPFYVFDPHALMLACVALAQPVSLPVWLYGDKGTGKTEFVRCVAAALGRPWHRVQCDRYLERAEFIGAEGMKGGNSVWTDGAILAACRVPGAMIHMDEPSYLQQGNVAVLNGLLEVRAPRQYRTAAGELVTFADDVSFWGADNTNGTGDASGQFVGTHALNPATCERFSFFIRLDFLPAKQEAKVLRARTGARAELCAGIVSVLNACRAKAASGHIPSAPSMRGAVAFLHAVQCGVAPQDAFEAAVTARAAPEAQEEIRSLFVAHWPAALAGVTQQSGSPFGTLADAPAEE